MIQIIDLFIQNYEFLYLSLVSLVLGAVIGLEREHTNKPAGVKTHVLICLGSTVFTYLSFNFSELGDPGRIAAQIVSGIGFIGGGAILQAKRVIRGLTTAATLWMVTAIGMLVGAHFIVPAIFVTIIVSAFLITANSIRQHEYIRRHYSLHIEIKKIGLLEVIEDMIEKFSLVVEQKTLIKKDRLQLEINYMCNSLTHHLFLKQLLRLKGVGEVISI